MNDKYVKPTNPEGLTGIRLTIIYTTMVIYYILIVRAQNRNAVRFLIGYIFFSISAEAKMLFFFLFHCDEFDLYSNQIKVKDGKNLINQANNLFTKYTKKKFGFYIYSCIYILHT